MSKAKIGVTVDESTWNEFRQWVQNKRGRTRGVLGEEVERALEERMDDNTADDAIERIESDVATIKTMLAQAESDGGVSTEESRTHTHAPCMKPPKSASTQDKVDWVIEEHFDRDGGSATNRVFKNKVKEEYGFGERTLEKYPDVFVSILDAEQHPENDDVWVWGDNKSDE